MSMRNRSAAEHKRLEMDEMRHRLEVGNAGTAVDTENIAGDIADRLDKQGLCNERTSRSMTRSRGCNWVLLSSRSTNSNN